MLIPNPVKQQGQVVNVFKWVKRNIRFYEQLEDYIFHKSSQLVSLEIMGATKEKTDILEESDIMTENKNQSFQWTKNCLYSQDENLKDYIAQQAARCVTLELLLREPIQSQLN